MADGSLFSLPGIGAKSLELEMSGVWFPILLRELPGAAGNPGLQQNWLSLTPALSLRVIGEAEAGETGKRALWLCPVQNVVFSLRDDSLPFTEPIEGASERIAPQGWSFLSAGETAGWFQLSLWRRCNKENMTCPKVQWFVVSLVSKHRAEGKLPRNRFLAGEEDGGSGSKPSGSRLVQNLMWAGYVSPGSSGNHTTQHSLGYLAMYSMPRGCWLGQGPHSQTLEYGGSGVGTSGDRISQGRPNSVLQEVHSKGAWLAQ